MRDVEVWKLPALLVAFVLAAALGMQLSGIPEASPPDVSAESTPSDADAPAVEPPEAPPSPPVTRHIEHSYLEQGSASYGVEVPENSGRYDIVIYFTGMTGPTTDRIVVIDPAGEEYLATTSVSGGSVAGRSQVRAAEDRALQAGTWTVRFDTSNLSGLTGHFELSPTQG